MQAAPAVVATVEGTVGILELNRPDKFNCLSRQSQQELLDGLRAFEADARVRAILVCATGKHFCTGADLDGVLAARQSADSLGRLLAQGHRTLRAIETSPLPTVVAVQGLCLAGGLELMLACDVAFAAADAQFGDQHAAFGLVPGWGGSQRLTRIVGQRRALDLFYTARRLDAATAQAWGLVNYVSPPAELRQQALDYCRQLGRRSAAGLAAMKQLARQGQDLPLAGGLSLEESLATRVMLGPDVDEGLAAFAARREPVFGQRELP